MAIDTQPVITLEDARRLGELVYSTYGLTYHRSFIYEAERLLELNRDGSICSMIAVDRDSGQVVGHQATIRPWFEIADPLAEGRGAPVLEDGLSIVHPDWRGRGIQNTLALALLMYMQPRNPDLRGFYIKCVTGPVASQKSARRFMGRATCLFLAGVPAWVVMDGDSGPKEPITTVLVHCPFGEKHAATVPVPARHAELLQQLYRAVDLPRELEPVSSAPAAKGPTELRTWFDPARRQGVVRVAAAGEGLADQVGERVRWMAGGHIEHVTVLLPLSAPDVAAAVGPLEEQGLFFGGFIPDLEGTDTLVMEWVKTEQLDASRIEVLGDEGEALLEYVVRGWRRSKGR